MPISQVKDWDSGAGLYGTAADYLAFEQVFLNERRANGRQVLQPETVRLMSENAIGNLNLHLLKTADPTQSNDAEFFPGTVKKFSLGFMVTTAQVPRPPPFRAGNDLNDRAVSSTSANTLLAPGLTSQTRLPYATRPSPDGYGGAARALPSMRVRLFGYDGYASS